MIQEIITISLSAILIENFLMVKFLGICPFLGVSKKVETATGMSLAVTFVMTLASAITYLVNKFILVQFHLEYLQTIAFILVIAALVQFVEMVVQKISPSLYAALGVYLPLITTNCAVLGVALLNVTNQYNFAFSVLYGFMSAVGFSLVIIVFSTIRERLDLANIPKYLRGFPIALISAALMAIAFLGFSGLNFFQ